MSRRTPIGQGVAMELRQQQDMREDRYFGLAILAVFVFLFGLALYLIKWLVSIFGGGPDLLGPGGSILLGFGNSLLVIGFLTVISGDGLMGELSAALSGFLLLGLIFSTLTVILI